MTVNQDDLLSPLAQTSSALEVKETSEAATVEIIASGLDSPRGLTFGSDSALYVTEAGRGGDGPSIPSPSQPGAELFYGATGGITRIQDGKQERVVDELPSLALPDGSDASGIQDIEFDETGKAYAIFGLAGSPSARDNLLGIDEFGSLVTIDNFGEEASWTKLADLAAFEGENNPDGHDIISNPFDLLIKDDTALVIDSGGNDLLEVGTDGKGLDVKSVFDARSITAPSENSETVVQPVPTAIAEGPDGAYYVAELTGFPFIEDAAQIYRIDPNGEPEVYADGFTQIIDLAFDDTGGLYVLEYGTRSQLSGDPSGALFYVTADGERTTITDELISPTGLTIGPDDAIYVSDQGFRAGEGQVVRIENPISQPLDGNSTSRLEPSALSTFIPAVPSEAISKQVDQALWGGDILQSQLTLTEPSIIG